MEEGLVEAEDSSNGSGVPVTTAVAATPAVATAGPASADGGSRNEEANAPAAAESGAPASAAVVLSPGEDRWAMNDGAADLAERGVELEMGGAGLPSSSSLSPPFLLGAGGGGAGGRRRGRKRNRQEWTGEAEAEVGAALDCCILYPYCIME